MYNADVAEAHIQLNFNKVEFDALYLPAYVIEYSYVGHSFRAFVCGATGEVSTPTSRTAFWVESWPLTRCLSCDLGRCPDL